MQALRADPQIYDDLYRRASEFMDKHKPCKVINGRCIRGRCGVENFCCAGCRHVRENGCSVIALKCRTWLCQEAIQELSPEVLREYSLLLHAVEDAGYWAHCRLQRSDYFTETKHG